jgi:DNA-binding response OmpR family regulator
VLLVEDDAALREVIELHLRAEGWDVEAVGDGRDALARAAARLPDVVVLDIMLPGADGIEVCRTLRAVYHPSPGVVMVTAKDSEIDVILGFDVGADDYVVKPCRPKEVVARVRALARRVRPLLAARATPQSAVVRGAITVDEAAHEARVGAELLKLTPTEFAILATLARAPEKVFSRVELLRTIFDTDHDGYARNVDCHVNRLRRKLEGAGLSEPPIRTVHGVGYRFGDADA